MKQIFVNKRLGIDFQIEDKLEVGIKLFGWEVKSIKSSRVNMSAAYVEYTKTGELVIRNMHVSSWESGVRQPDEIQNRGRKLLAHAREISKLGAKSKQPGFTLVPVSLYINDRGFIKLEIALVKGRKKFEKKQKIKERDLERQMQQEYRF